MLKLLRSCPRHDLLSPNNPAPTTKPPPTVSVPSQQTHKPAPPPIHTQIPPSAVKVPHSTGTGIGQEAGFVPVKKRFREDMVVEGLRPSVVEVTFLGTSAGSPTTQRNVSSLVVRLDGDSWMFDCGEATQHQVMRSNIRPLTIKRIFITHLHADHVMGLPTLLSTIKKETEDELAEKNKHPFTDPGTVNIYGPAGLRQFLRTCLRLTQTHSSCRFRVHELLRPGDRETPPGREWSQELEGNDYWCDEEGVWRDLVDDVEGKGVSVQAARIEHTVNCVGYVLRESNRRESFDMSVLGPILKQNAEEIKSLGFSNSHAILSALTKDQKPITLPQSGITFSPPAYSIPGRCLVILGDTSNPSAICKLFPPEATPPDLLIHEATGTTVSMDPKDVEPTTEESDERKRMKSRGHSTANMAGAFAARLGAKSLILNHLTARIPAPRYGVIPPHFINPQDSSAPKNDAHYPPHKSGLELRLALKPESTLSNWSYMDQLPEARKERVEKELKVVEAVEAEAEVGWRDALAATGNLEGGIPRVLASWDHLSVRIPMPRSGTGGLGKSGKGEERDKGKAKKQKVEA